MRKYRLIAVFTIMTILFAAAASLAKDIPIKVYIDGTVKKLAPSAFSRENIKYLPLNAVTSAVGGKTVRDKKTGNYTITIGKIKAVILKTSGINVKGKFFVKVNVFADAADYAYRSDNTGKLLYLTKITRQQPPPPPVMPPPARGG